MHVKILTYLSIVSPLFVLVYGWRQRFSLLWLYAAAGLIIDSLGLILKAKEINHHVSGNIFILIELICITSYYRRAVFSGKQWFLILSIALIVAFISHTVFTSGLKLNFLGAGMLCAFYISFGIVGYIRMLNNTTVLYINRLPFFWINTAFFLYAASNCLLFLFANYLRKESFELMISVWFSFFVSINILRYIFIGIGLKNMSVREA